MPLRVKRRPFSKGGGSQQCALALSRAWQLLCLPGRIPIYWHFSEQVCRLLCRCWPFIQCALCARCVSLIATMSIISNWLRTYKLYLVRPVLLSIVLHLQGRLL